MKFPPLTTTTQFSGIFTCICHGDVSPMFLLL